MAPLKKYMQPAMVLAAATAGMTSAFLLPAMRPVPAPTTVTCAARTSPLFSRSSMPSVTPARPTKGTILSATNFFESFFAPKSASGAGARGGKKTIVLTGTSSGLGKATLKALCARGDNFVICGVRDMEKMQAVAEELGLDPSSYTIRPLDLSSFASVRRFAKEVKAVKGGKPLDALVCNAAVYLPARDYPTFTPDGIEESLQINHLSHFLLVSLLLDDLKKAKDPRCVIVGSITGNDNTIAGAFVWPRASLGDLKGMQEGAKEPVSMIDGKNFNGAKAYKDSKMCNMMTVNELHKRYHDATGITFSSMYPGCIAETALFREKRQWFRTLFPLFMKYVTGGYVSENEAGERLAQTVWDPALKTSGQYWCWNGQAQQFGYYDPATKQVRGAGGSGGTVFPGKLAGQVMDQAKAEKMWELSSEITGATWPSVGVRELANV
ncbi:light-dependent NADPH:protochlorophyllide oxidoreductase [Nannochloropsis gaditana CCMP526]|uniref:light-dependent NADPH:protochlorophyllide oxidoreductase n=1 Tax=Nannochloropsis gaditana (strain CCMP526) TaxID=1093141 RepID=UPI00029F7270|nr:light-dependent NADPH:protochlorophyllide oxidoreductase [Nannochloropsis gaditana CCMP526]EKU22671.1 light-dependent NADPH:protochlorophyllide oxidoreductase [Nannochloropsis gaditana CCMP526]|eukprot:XP_005853690.1 light-dependent NADPH:protochlorophyllide oxidoreductase [Nannochloropsis gaditana CCMP526]